jgi:hypothetical protein
LAIVNPYLFSVKKAACDSQAAFFIINAYHLEWFLNWEFESLCEEQRHAWYRL